MLVSSPWLSSYDRHTAYLPPRPSPLSPRSANACQPYHQPIDMPKQTSPSRLRHQHVPFSRRPIKETPFSQRSRDPKSREAARETRRKLFLQQVAQKREDKRFEERGDQLLRLDWRSERRRWEDEKAGSAPGWFDELDEAEDAPVMSQDGMMLAEASQMSLQDVRREKEGGSSGQTADAEEEAERLREQEEAEMEGLLALMDEQGSQASSRYGSDDDFDDIFSELVHYDGGGATENDDLVMVERQGDVDMSG